MTNEQREALERYHQGSEDVQSFLHLAEGFAADHLVDDEKPLTVDYLFQGGWQNIDDTSVFWWTREFPMLLWSSKTKELRIGNSATGWHIVSTIATRGQLRRLIKALKGL